MNRSRRLGVVVVLLLVLPVAGAQAYAGRPAQPGAGDLDRSFSTDGRTTVDFGRHRGVGMARDVLVRQDRRVVVVGELADTDRTRWVVARLRRDGTPDRTFSSNGRTVTAMGAADSARVVVPFGAGRILVGGVSDATSTLVAYRADGSLAAGWGEGGIVHDDLVPGHEDVRDVRVLPDGRVLAVSDVGTGSTGIAVTRHLPDGTLDPSFGVDGVVRPAPFDGTVRQVALQPDGGLIAVGNSPGNDDPAGVGHFSVARYLADGSPDPSFGGDGSVRTGFDDEDWAAATAVAVQPDGRIVVSGWTYGPGDYSHFATIRYLVDGSVDPGFGTNGRVVHLVAGYYSGIEALALQSDGRIVAVGWTSVEGRPDAMAVARYTRRGRLDKRFSHDGIRVVGIAPGRSARAHAVALTAGRIVAAGETTGGNSVLAVVRLRQ